MDVFEPLIRGIVDGLHPTAILFVFIGVAAGIVIGAAPGLGPTMGMAIALPFAINTTPEYGVFLLVSILVGANFGNSIAAVLLRIPGTPSALLTVYEGSAFHSRGDSNRALALCLYASFIGQIIGILAFILFVVPLAHFALQFLFPEIFAVTVFGLLAAGSLFGGSRLRGIAAVAIGLFLSTIGPDPITGVPRFHFGVSQLQVGLGVVPVLVGLLALREVFTGFFGSTDMRTVSQQGRRPWSLPRLPLADLKRTFVPSLLGSVVGTGVGSLPGTGASVGTFVAYKMWRTTARNPAPLGSGSRRALTTIDASQNAGATAGLIPTLGLGIPGSAPMVLVMGALASQGLILGPNITQSRPGLMYSVFGGLLVATAAMVVLGYLIIGPSVYLSSLSRPMVLLWTCLLIIVGVYAVRWSIVDVYAALFAGLAGFAMERGRIPVAPAALAFVLGGVLETSLRRGLVLMDGVVAFVTRPITLGLLVLAALFVLGGPVIGMVRERRRVKMAA